MDDLTLLFIVGVVITTLSLLLHIRKRFKRDEKQKLEHQELIKAAHEREIRRQKQSGQPVKNKSGALPKRISMPDTIGTPFSGAYTPQNIAKWEVEIDQIRRSVNAQIDTKMLALQTLTVEADRSASRLEILIEHLENLIKKVKENNREEKPEEKQEEEKIQDSRRSNTPQPDENNLIRNTETENIEIQTFSEVAEEFEEQIIEEQRIEEINTESKSVKIIHPSSAAPEESTQEKSVSENPLSLSSVRLPSDTAVPAPATVPSNVQSNIKIQTALSTQNYSTQNYSSQNHSAQNYTVPFVKQSVKAEKRPRNALSLETLYNDTTYKSGSTAVHNADSDTAEPVLSPHLSLRRQAEVLADSGYTANQIAQTLNITVGEVDLMLSLRRD